MKVTPEVNSTPSAPEVGAEVKVIDFFDTASVQVVPPVYWSALQHAFRLAVCTWVVEMALAGNAVSKNAPNTMPISLCFLEK